MFLIYIFIRQMCIPLWSQIITFSYHTWGHVSKPVWKHAFGSWMLEAIAEYFKLSCCIQDVSFENLRMKIESMPSPTEGVFFEVFLVCTWDAEPNYDI